VSDERRVFFRAPTRSDQEEFLELMRASRSFHKPWASAPTDEDRFAAYLADARRPDFAAMLICRQSDAAIIGFFNLSQIVRRGLQSAYLGYAVGEPHAGQGSCCVMPSRRSACIASKRTSSPETRRRSRSLVERASVGRASPPAT
jgi:RimJ/RimL family protein N-acetyltransferase